jgi:hypothetical protein
MKSDRPGSKQEAEDSLLRLSLVEGQLRSDEGTSDLRWAVTIGRQGGIALLFEPIDLTAETAWLLKAAFPEGRVLRRFSVTGLTQNGIRVESEYVYIVANKTESDASGTRLILTGDASRLRIAYQALPQSSENVLVTYLTVGLRAFGGPSVETSFGKLTLVGPTEIKDPDHLNGRVHIQSNQQVPLTEWLTGCDRLMARVLDMLSFAEGGLIRWSVRQIETKEAIVVIDCEGPKGTGPAWDGAFHYLQLQPVLDLAVNRYTEELRDQTGLAVALEWFVHHPRYSELQLIAATTALEHLVSVFEQKKGSPKILKPELFEKLLGTVRPAWRKTLEEFKLPHDLAARMDTKLETLNEGNFRDKLKAMLDAYTLPLADLGMTRINDAVAARNRVIHVGLYRNKEDESNLQQHVAVLRELLKRICLTLLQYDGQYFSLLNGPHWTHFPPAP